MTEKNGWTFTGDRNRADNPGVRYNRLKEAILGVHTHGVSEVVAARVQGGSVGENQSGPVPC